MPTMYREYPLQGNEPGSQKALRLRAGQVGIQIRGYAHQNLVHVVKHRQVVRGRLRHGSDKSIKLLFLRCVVHPAVQWRLRPRPGAINWVKPCRELTLRSVNTGAERALTWT